VTGYLYIRSGCDIKLKLMPRDHRAATLDRAPVAEGLIEASQTDPVATKGPTEGWRGRAHDARVRARAREAERAATKRFLGAVFPYEAQRSSDGAQRAFEILGERWNLVILHAFADGPRRSSELEKSLEVPRRTLALRLKTLVAEGLVERRPYQTRPPRFEYRLSELGRSLYPALAHIAAWGERHLGDDQTRPLSGWVADAVGDGSEEVQGELVTLAS
jgi:DNA-binding HxlR family transcriptional regulator